MECIVEIGKWEKGNEEWRMENREWRLENKEWTMDNEELRVKNGEWRTANDEIENGKLTFFRNFMFIMLNIIFLVAIIKNVER